jgi:hypothetical protein
LAPVNSLQPGGIADLSGAGGAAILHTVTPPAGGSGRPREERTRRFRQINTARPEQSNTARPAQQNTVRN